MGAIMLALLTLAGYIVLKAHASSGQSTGIVSTPTIVPITSATTTTTAAPVTTTTEAIPEPTSPKYAVSSASFTLSEPGKYLCAPHGTAAGCVVRSMPLYIFYPAAGRPGEVVNGSTPDRKGGPFPLVVFGGGYLEPVSGYSLILDYWASRGYIVAAPQFPLSQTNSVGGPWEADILNQPGDLSAAITYMLNQNQIRTSVFYGLIKSQAIAVAGQSDGADDALALGYNTCCRDTRVSAVISLSGAELSSYPGKYFVSKGSPLLVVQGSEDQINLPSDSQTVFEAAGPPKYYLTLIGADHLDGYVKVDAYSQAVQNVTGSFLDYYLKGETGALKTMSADGNVAGVDSLS